MGHSAPQICLGSLTYAHTVLRTATKYCTVMELEETNISTRSTTSPALAKLFVLRRLTRELFAVANLQDCVFVIERHFCSRSNRPVYDGHKLKVGLKDVQIVIALT